MAEADTTKLTDVTPPRVAMNPWSHQLNGELKGVTDKEKPSDDSSPDVNVPDVPEISVALSSLVDAQTAVLGPLRTAVDSYEELRKSFNACKEWIFTKENDRPLGRTEQRVSAGMGDGRGLGGLENDKQIVEHEKLKEMAPELRAGVDNGLLAIADTLYLVGEFINMLNTAAQMYTNADQESFVPTE
ncbi:hypothetical protein [Micromonospora sp. DT233]|uniref:hypothetical protein n=1 Tax=Micromonospora sp. DT233 TaxID=3393432 RepID=UPI003CEC6C59